MHQIGNFSFIKRHNINTCDSTISTNNSLEIIKLLHEQDINRFKIQFNYLHISLVQVTVKPLFKKGLDIPVCALLRDAHLLNFNDSLLGIIQSNLADGLVYFNYYPNFSVVINSPNIMDILNLNVKTKNMNSKVNTREIAVINRGYYRLISITLALKAMTTSARGFTMLMEANKEGSNIFVPRTLVWNEIMSNKDWHFDAITQPLPSHIERYQIERVIQYPDGSIDLKYLDPDTIGKLLHIEDQSPLDSLLPNPRRVREVVNAKRTILTRERSEE